MQARVDKWDVAGLLGTSVEILDGFTAIIIPITCERVMQLLWFRFGCTSTRPIDRRYTEKPNDKPRRAFGHSNCQGCRRASGEALAWQSSTRLNR